VGVLVVLIGLIGLVTPQRFRSAFRSMSSQARFLAAILLRLGLGAFIWIIALADLVRRLSGLRRGLT
jgi:hypothetical protein